MEESKAAAYYDELTRKGSGAARFKQGLGFSSPSSSSPQPPPSLSAFVRSSSTTSHSTNLDSIRTKLSKRKPPDDDRSLSSRRSSGDRDRSRSRSRSPRRRRKPRSRSRSPGRRRSSPPRSRRSGRDREEKERGGNVDYSRLIDGYSNMTPAEKVKAKMKLQLSQTAKKDAAKGTGWERFDFNKEAPLDDEEDETAVAEDDAVLVKNVGKSFRFTAVEAKREDEIRIAHDEAMFGAPAALPVHSEEESTEKDEPKEDTSNSNTNTILSDKVVAMQRGSWRDRVRKPQ